MCIMQYKKQERVGHTVKVLLGLRPCKKRERERRLCAEGQEKESQTRTNVAQSHVQNKYASLNHQNQ